MDSVASAALSVVKSSADLNRGAGEGPPSAGPGGKFQKKSARISELLQESVVKDKLTALDAVAGQQQSGEGSGNLDGPKMSSVTSRSADPDGAVSGKHAWRKLNKAIVATKVLAGRPNALSQGRQPARQVMSQQSTSKAPEVPAFLLGPTDGFRERMAAKFRSAKIFMTTRMVILPETVWYQVWWFYYAVAIAIISCWVEPFQMAFQQPGMPSAVGMTFVEYVIIVTFLLDFILKFFVAYFDPETGMLVTTQPKMAIGYLKSLKFVLDVLGCFPYDLVVSSIAKRLHAAPRVLESIDWLKLLALSRAYRVFDLFHVLDYRMMLSQGTLMLLRNYIYVFFTAHWAACIFFHVAREELDFPMSSNHDTWVSRNSVAFTSRPVYEQYIMALYFSVTIFTSMGDGRLYPYTVLELSLMLIYLLFNLFLGAYIIGTVTIMMVRADEHSKSFRESISHLNEYSRENELPDRLYKAMREHLEVHFDSAQTTDDNVLGIYPTTIRRLVLRHLYLHPVRNCYLFKGCKQRFLDALLTVARVELFLPGVEIMSEGDNVVDLLVVMLGECLVSRAGQRIGGVYGTGGMSTGGLSGMSEGSFAHSRVSESDLSASQVGDRGERSLSIEDRDTSVHVGATSPLLSPGGITLMSPVKATVKNLNLSSSLKKGPSDALAEVAFFTDGASYETVVGRTPVRVLSLPKAAWELLTEQFPQQAKLVLDNVQHAAEAAVEENLKQAAASHQLTATQLHVALSLVNGSGGFADSTDPILLAQTRDALTHHQMEMITRLDDVRTVAATHSRKCDEMRTFEFLNTCAQGDVESLRTMLNQGITPNTADYDGRTGLMLAAAKGHDEAVQLLLDAGADKDKTDAFGNSALAEAVKNEHDSTIEMLLKYGATLGSGGLTVAAEMCTAVFEGDLVKLRRLLRSGAPPDSCDYDKRSALHIAGAEGNLAAVKLLVEEGGADPNFQDRWGNTALDEARRVGAAAVMTYLESRQKRDACLTAEKKRQQAAHDFMGWCNGGESADLRTAGGYNYGEEAGCAFAGLLLAASKGHTAVVEVLLEGMPSDVAHQHAHSAMLEAARMGHPETVSAFRRAGVSLRDPRVGDSAGLMHTLAGDLRDATQQGNGTVLEALLAAGVSGQRQPGDSTSPLHLAVEHGHLGACRRLVEHGGAAPDLIATDGLGRTPLQLAERMLQLHSSDVRARAVLEYMAWVTPLAAGGGGGGGGGMTQIAAAAVERWGPIGHPAVDRHAADVAAMLGSPAAGGRGASGGGGGADAAKTTLLGPVDVRTGERLTLPQRLDRLDRPASREAAAAAAASSRGGSAQSRDAHGPFRQQVAAPPPLRTVEEEPTVPAPVSADDGADVTTLSAASAVTESTMAAPGAGAAGCGYGLRLPAGVEEGLTTEVDVWDNLPGTPGDSTRGGNRIAQLLATKGDDGGEAAQLYNATVQHTAALLNEPPSALAASKSLAGCMSPVVGAGGVGSGGGGGGSMLNSPLPGPMARMDSGAGLGSPRLILPPSGAGRGLVPGSPGGFSRNTGSDRSAASRLFGNHGGGGLLASPSPVALSAVPGDAVATPPSLTAAGADGAGAGHATRASSVGSSRVGSAGVRAVGVSSPAVGGSAANLNLGTLTSWRRTNSTVPAVMEDEIEQYMGSLAGAPRNSSAGGGGGGGVGLPPAQDGPGGSVQRPMSSRGSGASPVAAGGGGGGGTSAARVASVSASRPSWLSSRPSVHDNMMGMATGTTSVSSPSRFGAVSSPATLADIGGGGGIRGGGDVAAPEGRGPLSARGPNR